MTVHAIRVLEEPSVRGINFRILPAGFLPTGRNEVHLGSLAVIRGLWFHNQRGACVSELFICFEPFPGRWGHELLSTGSGSLRQLFVALSRR